MAVHLILRLHEMHIAGGADRLVKLPAQLHDGTVEVPQLLLGTGLAVLQHEEVVAQRLDLQIVVERGDTLELLPVLVLHHRPEQLSGLTGGADDKALPVGRQLGLGDNGETAEILQVGKGHELVKMLQSQLVLGQKDDVLGTAVALVAQRTQLQHLPVDLLQAADAQLPAHFPEKRNKHITHHGRVVGCPVVVEGRQVQMLRHHIQLEFAQLRQQILRQDKRVHISRVKGKSRLPAALPNEADVKLGIVSRQRATIHESQKRLQCVFQRGCIGQHGIGDARETDNLRGQVTVWIHKGLEPVRDLPVFQHHGADLRDGLLHHLQSRGLNVKADDLIVKILIHRAVDRHTVIQIVYIISLQAVEDLDLPLGSVPRIGEGLHHAVVGDGDGRVAPGNGLLNDSGGVREGVHIGHTGVQMQLHPFFPGSILPGFVADLHDVYGVELHILAVPGQFHEALHPQPHSRRNGILQGAQFPGLHIFADGDGVVIVRQVEGQAPHPGAAGLITLGAEDLSLHHHTAHFGVQPLHGHGLSLDVLAQQHLLIASPLGDRNKPQAHLTKAVMLLQELFQRRFRGVRYFLPALHLRLQRAALPIQFSGHDFGVSQ